MFFLEYLLFMFKTEKNDNSDKSILQTYTVYSIWVAIFLTQKTPARLDLKKLKLPSF